MIPRGEFEFEKGIASIRTNRLAEAERWFSLALLRGSDPHDPLQRRAYVREQLGRLAAAARDYRRSMIEAPDCHECLGEAADVAVQRGRLKEAEAFLDRALELEPNNSTYRYDRGCIRLGRGRFKEAVEDFTRVFAFCREGRNMIALVGRAQARGLLGDLEGALQDLDRAVKMRRGVLENHFMRGIIRFLSKDTQGARRDLLKAGLSASRIRRMTKSPRGLKKLLKVPL